VSIAKAVIDLCRAIGTHAGDMLNEVFDQDRFVLIRREE
jgi:hypothetical protein